ncbi:MAG: ABC transporter substrate-binding protein [Thermodesulfobacteriota bacterium]|jgi:putative ABC transport system substrate-binding protein
MRRTCLFAAVLSCLCLAAPAAWGQAASGKTVVVGVLQYTSNNLDTLEGFKQGMADYGYVEGRNVTYSGGPPASSREELRARLAELLEAKPDLLFVSPTPAAVAAKEATRGLGIPVVFAPVNDPVAAGVVENIARPEGNLTGIRLAPSDGRRLESLKALKPSIRTVAVPYNSEDESGRESLRQACEAAAALGLRVAAAPIGPDRSGEALDGLIPLDADAVFLPRDGLAMSLFRQFGQVAEARRIPMSTPRYDQVREGVLAGYGFVGREMGRQAAGMANRLLKGVPVSRVPVETARDFLFVNLAAAGRIGLVPPDSVLRQAQYIIRPGE